MAGVIHRAERTGRMLRRSSAAVSAVVLAAGLVIASSPVAVANPVDCRNGLCEVKASSPGQSSGPISVPRGGGSSSGGSGGGQQSCQQGGQTVACQNHLGSWSNGNQCYMSAAQGIPAGAPAPAGKGPGAYYNCSTQGEESSQGGAATTTSVMYVEDGDAPPPQLVDPRVLAQTALERLPLATPNIQTAPSPPDMSYVTLETWLWMDQAQFAAVSESATAGPTTVTATARPVQARWTTGDGGSTTCASAGKPWVKGMTDAARTDCSYVWSTPSNRESGGTFELTATLMYEVTWTCSGACLITNGSLGQVPGPTATGAIRVGERQSVVVRG